MSSNLFICFIWDQVSWCVLSKVFLLFISINVFFNVVSLLYRLVGVGVPAWHEAPPAPHLAPTPLLIPLRSCLQALQTPEDLQYLRPYLCLYSTTCQYTNDSQRTPAT